MKHEMFIVGVLSVALVALVVATIFASRVPPKLLPSQTGPTTRVEMPSKLAPVTSP